MSKQIKIVLHDLLCTKTLRIEKNLVFQPSFQENYPNSLKSRNLPILAVKNQNNIHKMFIKT